MTKWILVVVAGALLGCQPSDRHPETVRERVLAGEFVEFTKPGYGLCGRSTWTDLRLGDVDERERAILGKQQSFINPGHAACYRIGETVSLGVFGRDVPGGGRVRIDRLGLVLLDKLQSRHLKGRYFASSEALTRYREVLRPRLKPEHEGIVTVVDFTYVSGTASDEAKVREEDATAAQGDGFAETTRDGDKLSACKSEWHDLSLPAEWIADARAGRLKSGYQIGERNCFAQGQTANLKSGFGKEAPAVANVRITKLKRFRVSALAPRFFVLDGFDYATLTARVAQDLQRKNDEYMTVIDFEVLP